MFEITTIDVGRVVHQRRDLRHLDYLLQEISRMISAIQSSIVGVAIVDRGETEHVHREES